MPTKENFYETVCFQINTGIGKDYCNDLGNEPLTEKSNKLEKKSKTEEGNFTGKGFGVVVYDPGKDELYSKNTEKQDNKSKDKQQ